MPSISQPSPYAEPNTPIASAKRPRTAVRHTGTPHAKQGAASSQGNHLLQSPPPACQLEKPSPEAGAEEEGQHQHQQHHQRQQQRRGSGEGGAGSEQGDGDGSSEGSWKGRVVSLFSPVLKFVGGHQQEGGEGQDDDEGGAAADENDLNVENRGPGGEAGGLQLHEESEGSGGGGAADAMDVEAPAMDDEEEEEEVEEYEGEEEEELEVVEEFNPFLFIKQLPPYEHVRDTVAACLLRLLWLWRDWLVDVRRLPLRSETRPSDNFSPSPPQTTNPGGHPREGLPPAAQVQHAVGGRRIHRAHHAGVGPGRDAGTLHGGAGAGPGHGLPRRVQRRAVPGPRAEAAAPRGVPAARLQDVRGGGLHGLAAGGCGCGCGFGWSQCHG